MSLTEEEKMREELVNIDRNEFEHLKDKVNTLEKDVAVFRTETKNELTLLLSQSGAAFKKIDRLCDEQKRTTAILSAIKYIGIGIMVVSIANVVESGQFIIKTLLPLF